MAGTTTNSLSTTATQASLRLTRERVGERQAVLGEGVGIEGDPRRQGHAAERGAGVGDDPLDRVAVAADRERLGDHGVDVRSAADLGEGDRPSRRPGVLNVTEPSPR